MIYTITYVYEHHSRSSKSIFVHKQIMCLYALPLIQNAMRMACHGRTSRTKKIMKEISIGTGLLSNKMRNKYGWYDTIYDNIIIIIIVRYALNGTVICLLYKDMYAVCSRRYGARYC